MQSLKIFQTQTKPLIEEAISNLLVVTHIDARKTFQAALRHSACDAGKRFRPLLTLATQQVFNPDITSMMPLAVAIELIHCFSLVHDDLPAMDDDDLRRGKPSCHKAYDEATAILAGDQLLNLAFEHIASDLPKAFDASRVLQCISKLSQAVGTAGLIGGQVLDMTAHQHETGLADLKILHAGKTGALIAACVSLPALLNTATETQQTLLREFGQALGLLFQIRDDIIDVTQSSQELGKTGGKDKLQNKATYVSLLGLDQAKEAFKSQQNLCLDTLDKCGLKDTMILADFVTGLVIK
eukprot:COSAG01_NODE_1_length_100484_cov_170.446142_56_plen_297_part_00